MKEKIIEFLNNYLEDIPKLVEEYGPYKIINQGLLAMLKHELFNYDNLRKELSLYVKRIIHEREFYELLDKTKLKGARLLMGE